MTDKIVEKLMVLADCYAEEMSGPCPSETDYTKARNALLAALVDALAGNPTHPLADSASVR